MKNNSNFGTLIETDVNKYHFNFGTEFQRLVWNEIAKIPKGKVLTYEQLALKINCPLSVRAVASACGKNPYVPKIPCHRVIRKDGTLGGYSAKGGIERKKYLLEKEGHKFKNNKIIF